MGCPHQKARCWSACFGCGKSLTAKAIATAWGVPLLRVDLGALKSKFVGESEGNLRKAFRVIEAIGRCVVWLDEIEKALQGATSGSADGGVSSDALGAILSWMQERSGEAFVIATANDVEGLPPELLRKGRFDEVWFVDLPSALEREHVLAATLRSFGRPVENIDVTTVARACDGFTGAELAALVPDAMFVAFADAERGVTTDDLLQAARTVVPLSRTAVEKVNRLREWAKGRARPANSNITEISEQKRVRVLDL
jgi:SpoVK/Ycf46/Vps4 family AAA+-type ATPase